MSCVESVTAAYRRAMDRYGEAIAIETIAGRGEVPASGPSRARIVGQSSSEIVSGIVEARRTCIILHEDLGRTPYAAGLEEGAIVVWNDRRLYVSDVDIGTRRIAGVTIAYHCRLAGG